MRKTKALYRAMPNKVRHILLTSNGWLVGSSIDYILKGEPVNDYDIIVPLDNWSKTVMLLADYDLKLNTFCGFKVNIPNGSTGGTVEVDIWPEDLDHFLKNASRCSHVFNLHNEILLTKDE